MQIPDIKLLVGGATSITHPFKFAAFACHVVKFHLCKNFLEILVIGYVFLQVLCLHCMLWDEKDSETVQNACIEAASTKLLV